MKYLYKEIKKITYTKNFIRALCSHTKGRIDFQFNNNKQQRN